MYSNVSSRDITGKFIKVNIVGIFIKKILIWVPIKRFNIRGGGVIQGGGNISVPPPPI